jgi:hypothetical protein
LAVNLRYPLQKSTMSEIEKLEQEKEFDAWGLSKILVRNIVVGFIICLLSAIGYLSATIRNKDSVNKQIQGELIICKEDATRQVERLKDQQIKLMEQISAIYEKQVEVERNVQATNKKLRNLDK